MGERARRAIEGVLTRCSAIPTSVRDEVVPTMPLVGVKVGHPRGMSGGDSPGWDLYVALYVGGLCCPLLEVVYVL
jgi:hypothetical protein